jgi:hypothetical protein
MYNSSYKYNIMDIIANIIVVSWLNFWNSTQALLCDTSGLEILILHVRIHVTTRT